MSWKNIIKMPVPAGNLTPVNTPEAAKKDFFEQLNTPDSEVNKYLNTLFEQKVDPILNQQNADGNTRVEFSNADWNSWGIKHNDHLLDLRRDEAAYILSKHYTKEMEYEVFHTNSTRKVVIQWGIDRERHTSI